MWIGRGFVLYYFKSSKTRKKMLADRVEENEDEEIDDGCFGGWRRVCGGTRYDMRPGLKMSCRVKFDVHPSEKGQMTLLQKGHANAPGSFWLRVDGGREKVAFSFFVNLGNGPEPRVSVLGANDIKVGEWYDVSAGWDGSNTWITVNGKTSRKRRVCADPLPGCAGPLTIGSMLGTMVDPVVDTPAPSLGDTAVVPGIRIACSAKFLREPTGETTIVQRKMAAL